MTIFRNSVYNSKSSELRNLLASNSKPYDIIYVDWWDGTDYLQKNAYVLEEVIKYVNTQKAAAGSTEKTVVLGQSMGGVIARWALADMEENGINHDVRLSISHDAPQQGANVPISYQYMYRHAANQYSRLWTTFLGTFIVLPIMEIGFDVSGKLSLLDRPASKQMLMNWSALNYQVNSTEHDNFYNELRSKGLAGSGGYPTLSRNVAISNGSECGFGQGYAPYDYLFYTSGQVNIRSWMKMLSFFGMLAIGDLETALVSLLPGISYYNAEIWMKAVGNQSGADIYRGKINYVKRFLIFKITTTITNRTLTQPSSINLSYDTYGGGAYNIEDMMNMDMSKLGNTFPNLTYKNTFDFIPTPSALDIGGGKTALTDGDYPKPMQEATRPPHPKTRLLPTSLRHLFLPM